MPYYSFSCGAGHVTEARHPMSCSAIPCPVCGLSAQRAPFNLAYLIGDTVPKGQATAGVARDRHGRYRLDIFEEASAEVAHAYEKKEKAPPNLYREGLRRARAMGAPIR